MLKNENKQKIKVFKKWASHNDVVFSFLAPVLGSKDVTTIIQTLTEKGYQFDARGAPIVESEEGLKEFISALREVVEEVVVEKATANFNKFWQRLGVDESLLNQLAEAKNEEEQEPIKRVSDA